MTKAMVVADQQPDALAIPAPETLILRAIEAGTPVESLEKLLGMRERLKAEQAREAYITAMAQFQAECPTISKTKVAGAGNYTYRYAPLEAIVEATSALRAECGFSYSFDTGFEDSPPAMVVTCIVQHRAGHRETSTFRSPIDGGSRMNVMQQSASALTYAKRYAFINAFGIVTGDEDNDAQTPLKAAEKLHTPPVRPAATQPPATQPPPAATSRQGGAVKLGRKNDLQPAAGALEYAKATIGARLHERDDLKAEVLILAHDFLKARAKGELVEDAQVTGWVDNLARRSYDPAPEKGLEDCTNTQMAELKARLQEWLADMESGE